VAADPRELARWRWSGLAIVVAGAAFHARKALLGAALPCEDGSILFARFYQEIAVGDWFAPIGGYVSFLPHVLASVLCRLPVESIPYAFAAGTALVSVLAWSEFLHPAWEAVAPARVRVVAVAAVAWLPLGKWALSTMVVYSQWHMLLWLFLLLLRPGIRSVRELVWQCPFVVALAFSHPLSTVLLPLALVRLVRRTGSHCLSLVLSLSVIAYFVWGREPGGSMFWGHAVLETMPHLLVRVGFECWFGTPAKVALCASGWDALVYFGGTVVALASWWLWRRARDDWSSATCSFVAAACYFAVAVVASSLLARGPSISALALPGQRYAIVARCCFVLCTVLAFAAVVRLRWVVLWLVAMLAVHLPTHRLLRLAPPDEGVRSFLAHLAAEEQRLGDRRAIRAELLRPDWPILIVPR